MQGDSAESGKGQRARIDTPESYAESCAARQASSQPRRANTASESLSQAEYSKPLVSSKLSRKYHCVARLFEWFVNVVILFNALQVGACVQPEGRLFTDACFVTDHVIVGVFVLEVCYKLYYLGSRSYLLDKWNVFDAVLAFVGALDAWWLTPFLGSKGGDASEGLLKSFKVVRILRILKLARAVKGLRIILDGLLEAGQGMFWVSVMLLMLIYCGAVMGVLFFQEAPFEDGALFTFDNVLSAMFTMFSLSILAEWSAIAGPAMKMYKMAWLFFVVFAFMSSFGILNLIIGVITERSAKVAKDYDRHAQKREEEECRRELDELADSIFAGVEKLDRRAMKECEGLPSVKKFVKRIRKPEGWHLADFHVIFDKDFDDLIGRDEFVLGMRCLLFGRQVEHMFMMEKSIAEVKAMLHEARTCEKSGAADLPAKMSGQLPAKHIEEVFLDEVESRAVRNHGDRADIVEAIRNCGAMFQKGISVVSMNLDRIDASMRERSDDVWVRQHHRELSSSDSDGEHQLAPTPWDLLAPGEPLRGPSHSTGGRNRAVSTEDQLVSQMRPELQRSMEQMRVGLAELVALVAQLRLEPPETPAQGRDDLVKEVSLVKGEVSLLRQLLAGAVKEDRKKSERREQRAASRHSTKQPGNASDSDEPWSGVEHMLGGQERTEQMLGGRSRVNRRPVLAAERTVQPHTQTREWTRIVDGMTDVYSDTGIDL